MCAGEGVWKYLVLMNNLIWFIGEMKGDGILFFF